jgi:hypothetical protein
MCISCEVSCRDALQGCHSNFNAPNLLCEFPNVTCHFGRERPDSFRFDMKADNCTQDLVNVLDELSTFFFVLFHILPST